MTPKYYFTLKAFLFSALFYSTCILSHPSDTPIITIKSHQIVAQMKALLKNQPDLSKTLILFDLDETLITQKSGCFLGTSDMFYFLKARVEKEKGMNTKEVVDYIDPVLIEIYKHIDLVLTDKALPEWIDCLKKRGATVLGFTARTPRIYDVTHDQLKKVNISFSPINTINNAQLFIKNGLYTVGRNQTKGQALERLLASSWCTTHNQIIFLDDQIKHLNHAADIMRKFSTIDFVPMLITPNHKTAFDPQQAMEQLCDFLDTHEKEPGIQALITQRNPWATETIKTCRQKRASSL